MRMLIGLTAALLLSGCAGARDGGGADAGNDGPPPIRLLGPRPTDLEEISGCWRENGGGRCVDKVQTPTGRLPRRVGERVELEVPGLENPTIEAALEPLPAGPFGCVQDLYGVSVDEHDGIYTLTPRAPAGRYRVVVGGTTDQGQFGGEFVWRTPTDSAPAHPRAQIKVVHRPSGVLEGDIFHLSVWQLPRNLGDASATIRVASREGNSFQFDAGRAHRWCPTSLDFAEKGIADSHLAATLGRPPFTYDVTLTLGGRTYRAQAMWPDDHLAEAQADDAGWVPLEFDPPLPQAE